MKEVEAKILEVNRQEIEEKLAGLNAQKVFDGNILTLFLDSKDSKIRKSENVLRLRQDKQKTELTFKRVYHDQEAKVAEEYSVEVSNLETTLKILEHLGFFEVQRMKKHRVSYRLKDARFDFDCYSGTFGFIPEFLEIEADVNLIHKYAVLLGFQEKDCLSWSTDDLIHHYSKKKAKDHV